MEAITILGIVGSVVSIGDVVGRSIKKLSDLKSRFRNVPRVLPTLIGQLYIIKAALDRLSDWSNHTLALNKDPRYQELAIQVNVSLDSFGPLLISLQQHLDEYDIPSLQSSDLTAISKVSFLWNEREMTVYLDLIDRQVNALNLLLQAVQCQTWVEQREVMIEEDSQNTLRLARDCNSSMIGFADDTSVFSEDTTALSRIFDFDNIVLGSRAYQTAQRSHLKHVVRSGKEILRSAEDENNQNSLVASAGALDFIIVPLDRSRIDAYSNERDRREFTPTRANNMTVSGIEVDSTMRVDSTANAHHPTKTAAVDRAAEIEATERAAGIAMAERARLNTKDTNPNKSQKSLQLRLQSFLRQRSAKAAHRSEIRPVKSRTEVMYEQIERDRLIEEKILILGTSESGKSTLLKLVKLYLEGGYSIEERKAFSEIVWTNIVMGTRVVLESMEALELPLGDPGVEHHVQTIFEQPPAMEAGPLPPKVAEAIRELWRDEGFQESYKRRHEYQLNDSAQYYATNIDRLTTDDCPPNDQDLVRSRVKTTGITETTFTFGDFVYRIFDPGGVRSERKKWIHCFWATSMIAFVVDAAAYNRLLFEDETVNRLQETMTLWNSIVNSKWFNQETDFILIFAKVDQLEEQLREHPMKDYFPDFESEKAGAGLVRDYQTYLEHRFVDLIEQDGQSVSQIRVAWANLVDVENNFAQEFFELVEELRASRKLGVYSPFNRNKLVKELRTSRKLSMSSPFNRNKPALESSGE